MDHAATLIIAVAMRQFDRFVAGDRRRCAEGIKIDGGQTATL